MTLVGADGSIGEGQPVPLTRRIIVSMVSLRNRLAAASSPSSPVRSRYSQGIWKESSSSWDSEMLMGGKRIRATRVPPPPRERSRNMCSPNGVFHAI
jgi:hypothetical protein